jgi:hypothetical protein
MSQVWNFAKMDLGTVFEEMGSGLVRTIAQRSSRVVLDHICFNKSSSSHLWVQFGGSAMALACYGSRLHHPRARYTAMLVFAIWLTEFFAPSHASSSVSNARGCGIMMNVKSTSKMLCREEEKVVLRLRGAGSKKKKTGSMQMDSLTVWIAASFVLSGHDLNVVVLTEYLEMHCFHTCACREYTGLFWIQACVYVHM